MKVNLAFALVLMTFRNALAGHAFAEVQVEVAYQVDLKEGRLTLDYSLIEVAVLTEMISVDFENLGVHQIEVVSLVPIDLEQIFP